MVTAAARVIAAAAYAFGAALTVISGLKKDADRGWMIVEAAFCLTVGVLYLIVPEEHMFLPMLLGILLWTVPTLFQTSERGQ